MISELRAQKPQIKPGLVRIAAVGVPGPDIRTYEYNLIFQEAYSELPRWYTGTDIPNWPNTQMGYYLMDVYLPSSTFCTTDVLIEANGYIGNKAIFSNFFNIPGKNSISVESKLISCRSK